MFMKTMYFIDTKNLSKTSRLP